LKLIIYIPHLQDIVHTYYIFYHLIIFFHAKIHTFLVVGILNFYVSDVNFFLIKHIIEQKQRKFRLRITHKYALFFGFTIRQLTSESRNRYRNDV